MDRNRTTMISRYLHSGALRKESVDRNPMGMDSAGVAGLVALRKESVDRNVRTMNALIGLKRSLSARRAWIEILR